MSEFAQTTSDYADRFGLSRADRLRLFAHYPLFKVLHGRAWGSPRRQRLAGSLLPLIRLVSLDHAVHGPGGSVRVRLRLTEDDVASFMEIFMGGEYDALLEPAVTYVDAGANTGMAAAYFATQHPLEQMLLIEANPDLATKLQQTVDALPHPVSVEHVALADQDGVVTFNIQSDHRMSGIAARGGRQVSVPSSTLRTLLDRHGIGRVDILKMDIEGAEHDVLAHDPGILDRVRSLIVEVHGEQTERDKTIALIGARGFEVRLRRSEGVDVLLGRRT